MLSIPSKEIDGRRAISFLRRIFFLPFRLLNFPSRLLDLVGKSMDDCCFDDGELLVVGVTVVAVTLTVLVDVVVDVVVDIVVVLVVVVVVVVVAVVVVVVGFVVEVVVVVLAVSLKAVGVAWKLGKDLGLAVATENLVDAELSLKDQKQDGCFIQERT